MSKRKIGSVQEAEHPSTKKSFVTQPSNSTEATFHPVINNGESSKRQNPSLDQEAASNKRQYTPPLSSITRRHQTKVPYTKPKPSREFLDPLFERWRKINPPAFRGLPLVQKPTPKNSHLSDNKMNIDAIPYKPRPKKTKQKRVVQPQFTIFEDNTATEARNPTPNERTTDPNSRFFEYNDEEAIEFYISRICLGTKRVIQNAGMKYATFVIDWLTPLAVHLDTMTPFTGRGFEERVLSWKTNQESGKKHGVTHPRWFKHEFPPETEEWFTVECVEQLEELMIDVHDMVTDYTTAGALREGDVKQTTKHSHRTLTLIAGYCLGFGGGMDIGSPAFGDYLEDGRRNPVFFRRLTAAWSNIIRLYLNEEFASFISARSVECHAQWVSMVRKKIGGDVINWDVMEHFWGDSFPPCDTMRSFGVDVKRGVLNRGDVLDKYGPERYQMGVDQLMYE
ncbi:hypothetical protein BKA65DRAFT_473805 [Rhexocercosporidium sp. MPI-PUGE-AT-0058]|nr:hypothetical protein BKA65DRAFT_473805 [Rhexocercosporidium sp. MPI-PUGE-AT-0058]